MKKLLISESEKSRILNLHKGFSINEDSTNPSSLIDPIAYAQSVLNPQEPGDTQTNFPVSNVKVPETNLQYTGGKTQSNVESKPVNYTIKQLQQLLNSKGYNVGTADGIMGKNTLNGIKSALAKVQSNVAASTAQQAAQSELPKQTKVEDLPVPERQQTEPEIKYSPAVSGQVVNKSGKIIPDFTNLDSMIQGDTSVINTSNTGKVETAANEKNVETPFNLDFTKYLGQYRR
jgi:hypothetical protein